MYCMYNFSSAGRIIIILHFEMYDRDRQSAVGDARSNRRVLTKETSQSYG